MTPAIAFATHPNTPRSADDARTRESPSLAVLFCAIGFFLIVLLPEQTLNMLGIPYGAASGSALAKIHPGDFFIYASFLILLCRHGNPVAALLGIARHQRAFFAMFAIYILILVYWALRGPSGIGMILDMHIGMAIGAIVFSYAPRAWCRGILIGFVTIIAANSAIGIGESLTHMRLLPVDPDWEVVKQDYFRASALLGHPLSNAVITAMALFIMLDMRLPKPLKVILFALMLVSLVGFGGRAAVVVGIAGAAILGIIAIWRHVVAHSMTVMRLSVAALAMVLVPLACGGALYAAFNSAMGARLMAYDSLQDDSALVRMQSWHAFDLMSPEEIIFGVDGTRSDQIAQDLGLAGPSSDIENPWILMLMALGVIMFTLWIGGLSAVVWRLLSGASPALKIAVIGYFVIASTSNSFGRKDVMFVLLPGLVICAKRLTKMENIAQGAPYP